MVLRFLNHSRNQITKNLKSQMTVYLNGKYITVNEFRAHLVSDGWVLTGSKKLESIEASIFFVLRGREEKKFCYNPFRLNCSSAVVETWLRNLDVSYQFFFGASCLVVFLCYTFLCYLSKKYFWSTIVSSKQAEYFCTASVSLAQEKL